VFAALADQTGVAAVRHGVLERVHLIQRDWQQTSQRLLETEHRAAAVVPSAASAPEPRGDTAACARDHRAMTTPSARGAQARSSPLAIYLNDHLGGATAGVELARRIARAHQGMPTSEVLARLAAEIAEDREALQRIMRSLGVPVQRYKVAVGWVTEKAARLKPNGRLLRRSPLSSVVELESLRIGIEGKAAGWQALRTVATQNSRLDVELLDRLLARADGQADAVEDLRLRAATDAFTP
jgi:hypothetical protein